MKKYITTIILCFCFSTNANALTGTEQVRKYFKIDKSNPVDEFVVRDAILKIAPMNTELKVVIARLERNGIKYGETCAPGDRTPLWCYFKSPKNQLSEANYVVEFYFDDMNKFKNVEVVRSYKDKVKEYTTYPTKPAKHLNLKNNLSVGSKVKEFDFIYGLGELNTSVDFAHDWPVTLEYHDKENNRYFYIGIEVGDISKKEMKVIEQDRKQLGEFKAGIIFVVWPDPQHNK